MFDVGFSELAVIFVVGLLVLGPERLPKVAHQVGQWAGKARRMARMLTTQLQDELNTVDPNRIMDPKPTRRQNPPPVYNRPGADDLIPGEPEPAVPAAQPAETRAESTPGNAQP
jgi:sec-independent protein translocase protein TatB